MASCEDPQLVAMHLRTGCSSLDLCGTALTSADKAHLSMVLMELFGDNYVLKDANENPILDLNGKRQLTRQAKMVWEVVTTDGWSRERFTQSLERFKRQKQYGAQWSVGDFLACSPEADTHDRAWMLTQVDQDWQEYHKSVPEKYECYLIQGQQAWRLAGKPELEGYEKIFPRPKQ